jgi:hypothetical protein
MSSRSTRRGTSSLLSATKVHDPRAPDVLVPWVVDRPDPRGAIRLCSATKRVHDRFGAWETSDGPDTGGRAHTSWRRG